MIQTVYLNKLEEVMAMISDQHYNETIHRLRSSYLYRGLPNARFELTTSLRRNCKHLHAELESAILRNFTKYASHEDPTLSSSVWKQMMVGQHYGLPTRLLDWTRSPLIALHFANSGIDFDKIADRDAVIWRVDMHDLNRNLPQSYRDALKRENAYVFTEATLQSVAPTLADYDRDMDGKAFVTVEPPSVDQRIINQYSFFSVIPPQIENVEEFLEKSTERTVRYILSKDIRWDVRDLLDQYNVSERIFFPGLDGLSRTLARHYFVK